MRAAIVAVTARKSDSIIVNLRFQRSTHTPASGAASIVVPMKKKSTSASDVARPVFWYAQILSAKAVIDDPTRDNTCPDQMSRKAGNP